jgi:crotonobetainyl-CoA:carnitine CoA-transferase CaiB-like acyl-CoA transferase
MSHVAEEGGGAGSRDCLSHLKVLELCSLVSGSYCAKLMADLGAEVIKIEPPGVGDDARRRGPFLDDRPNPETSGRYLYLNTNKLGITLDVTTEGGRRVLKELVRQCDVLVEDNPPALMEELRLTYDDLKSINDRLVMVSITPFGQTGPYRDYMAREINTYHAGGEGYLLPVESEYPDREPVKAGGLAGDCMCGLSAALATLAAVYSRRAMGPGQHVDVSRQDVLMTMVGLDVAAFTQSGMVRTRHSRHAPLPSPVRCQDGHIMITPWPDPVWETFARFVGNTEWAEDERYREGANRWLRGDEVNRDVGEWAARYDKDDLFQQLQENGVPAAPVNTSEDIARSQQMEARGFFSKVDHPEAGDLSYPTAGYRFSETPWRLRRHAPLLGEHNRLVYIGRLGYDESDLVTMMESGII